MPKPEERIQAFRWKLGLPGGGDNPDELRRIWEAMTRDTTELRLQVDAVSKHLARIMYYALRHKLTGENDGKTDWTHSFADAFLKWVVENERALSPKLAGVLASALAAGHPAVGRPPAASPPPPVAKGPPPKVPPPKGQGLHPGAVAPPLPPAAAAPPRDLQRRVVGVSAADAEVARQLSTAVEQMGYRVWWDRELVGGQAYDVAIEDVSERIGALAVQGPMSRDVLSEVWLDGSASMAPFEIARRHRLLLPVPGSEFGVKPSANW